MMKMFLQKSSVGVRRTSLRQNHLLRRLCGDTSASTATIFAIALVPLMLAIGGAVDFSRYYDARESVQAALDSSVLAGAAKNSKDIAAETFNAWKVTPGGTSLTVSSSNYTGCTNSDTTCTGTIRTTINTYFSALVGVRTLTLHVTSVAEKSGTASTSGGGCLWLLTNNGDGLLMNSNAVLTASQCQVNVNSTAMLNSNVVTRKLCVAKTATVNSGGGAVDSSGANALVTSCSYTPADPYAGKFTAPANTANCTSRDTSGNDQGVKDASTVTFNPGVYCGITFHGGVTKVIFNPGMYVLTGTFMFDGATQISGSSVTFYLAKNQYWGAGGFHFNGGNSKSVLSAPTSGACSQTNTCGVLMYSDGTSGATMDSGNADWTGIVYLPSLAMTYNSGSSATNAGTVVYNSVIVNSYASFTITSASSSGGSSGSIVRLKK